MAGLGHVVMGLSVFALYKKEIEDKYENANIFKCCICSILPDIDLIVGVFLQNNLSSYHRLLTHNSVLIPALLFLILFSSRDRELFSQLRMGTASVLSHLTLDESYLDVVSNGLAFENGTFPISIEKNINIIVNMTTQSSYDDIQWYVLFALIMIIVATRNRFFSKEKRFLKYKKTSF